MRSFFLVPAFLLFLPAFDAEAAPQPGHYTGVMSVKKRALGTPVTISTRAVARISETGGLSIVLLAAPSPFPGMPPQELQTLITANNTCIIPAVDAATQDFRLQLDSLSKTLAQLLPPLTIGGETISHALGEMIPEYEGKVEVSGNTFRLSYDDVPDRYHDAEGNLLNVSFGVALLPTAEFTFTFRRVGP